MAGYFNTLSDEKAEHPSAIVEDTVKLVQALHKHLLNFYSFFLSYDIMLHFLRIRQIDDLLQNIKFINQRMDAIIK